MRGLLNFLWKAFSLLGAVLSLRRWWRTLTDEEAQREERLQAGLLLLFMCGLLVWSMLAGVRLHRFHGDYAPTEIVVDVRDDMPLGAIAHWDTQFDVILRPNSPESVDEKLMIGDVSHLSPRRRARLLERLRRDPNVEAADPNYTIHLDQVELPGAVHRLRSMAGAEPNEFKPNDPRYGEQWNLRLIGMPAAWEKATGKGVVVAVIDTGCAFEPEAGLPAASDLKQTAFTKPYDFIHNKKKAYDDHGHGTHVAGTIAQSTNNRHGVAGIAYEATIMPLKVLSAAGSGQVSDIADAIRYAADNGAQAINMSLGGPRGTSVMAQAVTYAHQKGVTIVCAAGNGGGEGVGFPAAYPECIAVSSVGPSGNLAFYSSWGKQVAIAAPGGEYRSPEENENGVLQNTIFQKQDRFEFWQGTSMASPHVAGVAALLIQRGAKGPDAVRARLRETATPKNDEKRYGAGILNAAKALGAAGEPELVATAAGGLTGRSLVAPRALAGSVVYGFLLIGLLGLGRIRAPRLTAGLVLGGLPVAAGVAMLGTALHGHAVAGLVPCVAWPFVATAFLYGVRPLRPWLAGAWAGCAAGALALLFSGISPLWLLGNAAVALLMARLVTRPD